MNHPFFFISSSSSSYHHCLVLAKNPRHTWGYFTLRSQPHRLPFRSLQRGSFCFIRSSCGRLIRSYLTQVCNAAPLNCAELTTLKQRIIPYTGVVDSSAMVVVDARARTSVRHVLGILADSPVIVCVAASSKELHKLLVVRNDDQLKVALAPSHLNDTMRRRGRIEREITYSCSV